MTVDHGEVDDQDAEREPISAADEAELKRLFGLLPPERQLHIFYGFHRAAGGVIH